MLGEMILELDEPLPPVGPMSRGISTTPMSEELSGAAVRLLECLKSPRDSRILGRQTVREVVYRVLCGEQGGALRALASRDDHFARIARVLKHVHAEYAKPLSAEDMARRAGMSVSAFNHHFRLVTASSPLQYLKRIRLDHARRLMAHDGLQREHGGEGGRVREPFAIQPGVQAALRRHARRGSRADAGPPRGRLKRSRSGQRILPTHADLPGIIPFTTYRASRHGFLTTSTAVAGAETPASGPESNSAVILSGSGRLRLGHSDRGRAEGASGEARVGRGEHLAVARRAA